MSSKIVGLALAAGGWAEIHEELTFLNVIVSADTAGIYTPRTYTLKCSATAPSGGGATP
jgi:hypothetical protein